MDKRPKRTRDKYNPYNLHSEKEKNIYSVTFYDGNKQINTFIDKDIFDEFNEFEKEDARQIQKIARNNELNQIRETSLINRILDKSESIEELVISKMDNENLVKALKKLTKTQMRRIQLYYNYHLTLETIAKIDGCSKQSIHESIRWGMKKLKKYLKKF